MDVCDSVVGLVYLSPILLAAAVFIRIEDGGPIFVRQMRLGKGAVPFGALKFRTHRVINSGSSPNNVAIDTALTSSEQVYRPGAPTRVGRLLRCSSIDHLPLLVNILRGEMSLVGPHAALLGTANSMEKAYPGWSKRFACRPGLTGYAQVETFRQGMSKDYVRRMVDLDARYIAERNLRRDIYLIAQTVIVIFTGRITPEIE